MGNILNEYLSSGDKATCYSCSQCVDVCPTSSLQMEKDERGFFYPVLNKDSCINCRMCRESCMYHHKNEKRTYKLYAVQNTSVEVLEKCQSGGLFDAVSDVILDMKGAVYGCIIDKDLTVKHIRATTIENRNKMRMSKYTTSFISKELLSDIRKDILSEKAVLFTGTPCQCAWIQSFFGERGNLYTMDFICHGTPSQNLFQDYIRFFEDKNHIKIERTIFRIPLWKSKGLHTMMLIDTEGKRYLNSDYSALFYSHLGHRESCFKCIFADKERQTDITMGGFLDIELFKNPGNKYDMSMCIINSKKGEKIWESVKKRIFYQQVSYSHRFRQQPCLYNPITKPEGYDNFWRTYLTYGIEKAMKEYVHDEIYKKYHMVSPGGGNEGIRFR